MSAKLLAACAIVLCLAASTHAVSIKWTGYANNNQWDTPTNWYPDQVPSTNDDVTIEYGVVQVPNAAGCNSLTMGTNFNQAANLTIFNTFIVGNGGMTVDGNGNVFVNAGTASISGVVNVAGNLYFQSGSLSGQVTVSSRGYADLSGAAQKVLAGCSFSSAGSLILGGNLVLSQSSLFTVTSSATAAGNFGIQNGDGSSVLFDSSSGALTYNGGGVFSIQAPVSLGTFNFVAGNLSIYSSVNFVNTFNVPSGSFVSALGTAQVNMSAGVTGSGVLSGASTQLLLGNVNFTGYINVAGGNVTFATKSQVATLSLAGGALKSLAPVTATTFSALNGALYGSLTANNGYINSQGFDLNGYLTFSGSVTTASGSLIAFGAGSGLTFASGAQLNAAGSLQLTGVPGQTVTNYGTINANGAVAFQNINLRGTGTVNVAGTLQVSTNTVAQSSISLSSGAIFKGSNAMLTIPLISGTNVKAVIGSYTLKCGSKCTDVDTTALPTSSFSFSS